MLINIGKIFVISALMFASSCARAGNPMPGVAAGVALFEACADLSPELAQRYRDWLARPIPELEEIVEQARQLPVYFNFKKHFAEEFKKTDKNKLVYGCTVEFNQETWPDNTGRTTSAKITDKSSPAR